MTFAFYHSVYENYEPQDYDDLKKKRQELDMKMKEILGTENSILFENQNYMDSSVYTTLLWTVLATSCLYYLFIKI